MHDLGQDPGQPAARRAVPGSSPRTTTSSAPSAALTLRMAGDQMAPLEGVGAGDTMAMIPYVIRQGDYLTKLAALRGFDAAAVWNHAKNADLRDKRTSGNLLLPGDVLYVPRDPPAGLPITAGGTQRYRADVPVVDVEFVVQDGDRALADAPYVVEGLGRPGAPEKGSSDGSGKVKLKVPVNLRQVRVVFTERGLAFPVRVGDLDPGSEMSGIRQRLEHLGYYGQYRRDEADELRDQEKRDADAIGAFQKAKKLPVTGKLDDDTRRAIVRDHGG